MAQVDWEHQGQHLHPISPHMPLTQELEILQPCHSYVLAVAQGDELACPASLGQLQTGSGHSLCGSLSLLRLVQTGNCPHCEANTPSYPNLPSDCPLPQGTKARADQETPQIQPRDSVSRRGWQSREHHCPLHAS